MRSGQGTDEPDLETLAEAAYLAFCYRRYPNQREREPLEWSQLSSRVRRAWRDAALAVRAILCEGEKPIERPQRVVVPRCDAPSPIGVERCTRSRGHKGDHQVWKASNLLAGWLNPESPHE